MSEIIKIQKEKSDFLELGISGLQRQNGLVYEEFRKELQGLKGVEIFEEMRKNDPTVGATLFAIEMLIRNVEWRVESASDDSSDIEIADFVEECMHDMEQTWEEFISEALTMLTFGWAYHEQVFKTRHGENLNDKSKNSRFNDGRIGWRKIPLRSQKSFYEWAFHEDGDLKAMLQQPWPDFRIREIPIEKAVHFKTVAERGNPEGVSVLRSAYRSWYLKKNIEKIEAIGIERDLAGLPVVEVPPEIMKKDASAESRATLAQIENMIKNIRRDEQEGIVMPRAFDKNGNSIWNLKLLSTGGSRQFDVDKTINRYDRSIAGTVLADFILLGHESVGSFSLASSKTNLFAHAIGAWLKNIASTINRVMVPKLLRLNGFRVDEPPIIKHSDIEKMNLEEISGFVQRMAAAGMPMFPNPEIENFLLRQAGLPEIDEDKRAEDMAQFTMNENGLLDGMRDAVQQGFLEKSKGIDIVSKYLNIDHARAEKILT